MDDQESIEDRCAAHLIANFEAILAKVLKQERRRWVEICKTFQLKIEKLQSEVIRLNVQVQSHQLESTRRGLWLKRKASLDGPEERPRKLSRQQDPAQGFASSLPSPSCSTSMDTHNVVQSSDTSVQNTVSGDLVQLPLPGNGGGATPSDDWPARPIARLPNQIREAGAPAASNEQERVVYCLCGGHEYGIMIHCDSPGCELGWFHVGCVDLEDVPGQDEEWFCPACIRSREVAIKLNICLGEFASSGMQAIPVKANSACQTDRVLSRSPTPAALPLTPPQEPSPLAALPPVGAQPPQRLLSPFEPLSIIIPGPNREALEGLSTSKSPGSTISTLTPLSTSSRHTPNTFDAGCSSHHRPQDQGVVWIALDAKLVKSSRKSLFQRLHPTGRKPWEN